VGKSLLLEFYLQLPRRVDEDAPPVSAARFRAAVGSFKRKVARRYNEGTLQRLLQASDAETRQAAIFALGLLGTMESNRLLAQRLRDEDTAVRIRASDALWSLWLRADTAENNKQLQRLMRLNDVHNALEGYAVLLEKSPHFAEAYNQRAILYYRLGEYQHSLDDCEKVIELNPVHFGALSGMAQCLLRLRKPRQALKAFRNAYRINPNLEGVKDTIRELEDALGEEKGKDDKK
jgi:tetratricopeptide (TPR) repeat protein